MKTVEIIGYKRANLGKAEAKSLRESGSVPCVIYGGDRQIHFHTPMSLFKDIVYTPDAHFVNITIEGEKETFRAILKDVQFHPISEIILHADFLQLFDDKIVKMNIPLHTTGNAPGIQSGGKLIMKVKYLKIKALPKDMPESIEVDISGLGLGKSVKVGALEAKDYEIMNNPLVTLASIEVPRALRGKESEEEEEEG